MEGFSDEPLQFIVDLTQKHPDANIAVDEANLRDLSDPEQKTICHEDFKGHLWISISSIYKHDFQEQGQTAIDLDLPPCLQGFCRSSPKQNLRNNTSVSKKFSNFGLING